VAGSKSAKGNLIKSEQGPKRSRPKNALDHGIYAEDMLLPWESPEELENLFAELQEEFQPDGRMEKEVVLDLAHLRWQKQRLRKMWYAAANSDPFVNALVVSGKQSWTEIRGHLRSHAEDVRANTVVMHNHFLQFAEDVKKLFGDLIKDVPEGLKIKGDPNQQRFVGTTVQLSRLLKSLAEKRKAENEGDQIEMESPEAPNGLGGPDASESKGDSIQGRIKAVEAFANEGLLPLMKNLETLSSAETALGRAFSPEFIEPVIRVEALIDARIDKLLGRLVSLKEYKKIAASYQKPALEGPSKTADP